MNELLIFLLIIPLAGAFISALGKYSPRFPLAESASVIAVLLCLGLLAFLYPAALQTEEVLRYRLGNWPEPVGISLYLDGLAWISSLIGMIITLAALLFAVGERRYKPSFYFFFLLLVFGMEGVILTGDLFNMFVFLEILSIASYILIAYSRDADSLVASFRYLMISSLGIAFFLLGIFLLYQTTGTLSLRLMGEAVREAGSGSLNLELAIVCLAVGAGVKAAFIPFHTWLPSAHAAAPHPVSAVLSGVMIKVSFLVVWRLLGLFGTDDLQSVFLWVGSVTALFGVAGALAQTDSKKLLAYHSVSQMGYIMAAFGAGSSIALTASLYHLVNHSLFKSLLFLSVGAVVYATGERNLKRLGNLGRKMIFVFLPFLVGAFSISSIPPFNGYASKNLISESLKDRPGAYGLVFLAGAGTVASFLKLSGIFARKKASSSLVEPARNLPPLMYLPLVLLALLCLATGVLPGLFASSFSAFALAGDPPASGELPENLPASLYSLPQLAALAVTLAIGSLLYVLFIKTKRGDRILKRLRSLSLDLNAALSLLIVGFLVLVLLTWLL